MLRNTFRHIPHIGAAGEQRLWDDGVHSWDRLPPEEAGPLREHIDSSLQRLAAVDPHYFAQRLPSREHWRLFPEFRGSLAYLDIETTGLYGHSDDVTTIALYDGRVIRHYVRGRNLDDFRRDIAGYRVIVTYNGKTFDVPFIAASMGLRLDHVHIDLRYVLRSLGYRGGLKGCERQLGLDRGDLVDVDGFFAVLLWRQYLRRRDEKALETLLAYNIQDVVNLERLLVIAYNMKLAATPFAADRKLAEPAAPVLPFSPDHDTIERLRGDFRVLT